MSTRRPIQLPHLAHASVICRRVSLVRRNEPDCRSRPESCCSPEIGRASCRERVEFSVGAERVYKLSRLIAADMSPVAVRTWQIGTSVKQSRVTDHGALLFFHYA